MSERPCRAERARREQQRIARQERRDDEAGLREDDREQDAVDPRPVGGDELEQLLVGCGERKSSQARVQTRSRACDEVFLQVLDVLDARRDPHQAVGDAERRAPFGRHRRVRHRRRVRDQRLDAAEAFGQRQQPDAVQEAPGRLERPEVERQHAAEAAHLPRGQLVLRVGRQARDSTRA